MIVAAEQAGAQAGQGFTFELAPGAYTLADPDSGEVLGEPAGGVGDGPALEMQDPQDTASQRFALSYDGGASQFQARQRGQREVRRGIRGGTPESGTIVER